ncbi:MAG: hypothetical protein LH480_10265 [Rubrivivax sp.]|nr:hypothetical protein [Rubrivivax sp.]
MTEIVSFAVASPVFCMAGYRSPLKDLQIAPNLATCKYPSCSSHMLLARLHIYLHDIAVLTRDAGGPKTTRREPSISVHEQTDAAGILAAHKAVGHHIPGRRLQQRLGNGLRFLRMDAAGAPVATTWVVGGGGRYIDELNWLLPMAPDELWVRDVFVMPSWRGRRLFADIATCLADRGDGQPRRVWSDVDWLDAASMRAHQTAGFRVVARVRALDFAGRVRLRSALPSWPLPVREIDPTSRLILLRGSRLRRHRELIA